jgi:hypothetical protein
LFSTACWTRHCFVWLSLRQTLADVIVGFEAAWSFFGGVFPPGDPRQLEGDRHGIGSA